ncbi:uncharacterized protein F5147DRAFT_242554 [Suillus discolor]|uniref:Crinkler effector protein N-terminal domain-containing protein n=1 Tax=Suillus discolor TaxID=1912936 RepID=A0A9P7JSM5_9AGAM|nr:uncharacterized protein F5147DRAFT_242554 [Suillus discolor]KAG2105512.1 hypothetical protein F5147DRAFT_242554 [Suillus discolor]
MVLPGRIFSVNVAETQTVDDLRKVIKDANKPEFDHVAAYDLKLWQVDLPIDETIEHNLSSLKLDTKKSLYKTPEENTAKRQRVEQKSLSPVAPMERVFPNAPDPEHLHIVIRPPHFNINCVVLDDPDYAFTIKIAPTENVSALQKAIKDAKKPQFDHVAANHLKVWQVNIKPNDLYLLDAIEDQGVALESLTELSEAFVDGVERGCIHVIVRESAVEQGEVKTNYTTKLDEDFKNASSHFNYPFPSAAAKSKEYCNIQRGPRRLCDGRYAHEKPADTTAPPIQLFNPAFAYFSSKAFDPEYVVPNEVLRDIQNLMPTFAAIHPSENDRKVNLTPLLEKVIQQTLLHMKGRRGGHILDADAIAVHVHGRIPIHLVVVEEKNEVGDGGSDPSVQASFSFVHLTRDSQYTELRSKCNCPTFLVVHAGPWLAVLGAVFTEKYIVQRLTDFIWIPVRSALDDDQFLRIGRVLYALTESVAQLRDWYDNVLECGEPPYDTTRPTVHSRFFPTPHTYLRDEIPVQFKYERPLERDASCVTYLAKTQEDNPINVVVKFVTRYGEDVHMAMAEAGFAPKLLYYGKIDVRKGMPSYGGLRMVVMEYVDGTTACSSLRLPPSFHQELEDAMKCCHEKGFVFCDLRKPNIMITKDGKVQLIDFDWAGRKGEVKYPVSISPAIKWPKGAQGLGPILEEHDRDMLVRYCS